MDETKTLDIFGYRQLTSKKPLYPDLKMPKTYAFEEGEQVKAYFGAAKKWLDAEIVSEVEIDLYEVSIADKDKTFNMHAHSLRPIFQGGEQVLALWGSQKQ